MTEVTHEDRLAAKQIYQRFRDHDYAKWIADGTNAGGDADAVIQLFKAHRIAAEARGMEQAAMIALSERCVRGTPWDHACVAIAAAIRKEYEPGTTPERNENGKTSGKHLAK